jgi:type IV fimbrial biogenesis protein FimT
MKAMARGTALIALIIYLSTGLFVWFVSLPMLDLVGNADKQRTFTGDSLESCLEYARDMATHEGQPITVCASANGRYCSQTKDWSGGWIMFTDGEHKPGQLNPGDNLLYAHVAGQQSTRLGVDAHYVRYLADGGIELD